MGKAELRKQFLALRKNISDEDIKILSEEITCRLMELLIEKPEIRHIHIFLSLEKMREVNTASAIAYLLKEGYLLYTSKLSDDRKTMFTVRLVDQMSLGTDRWGIPVPEEYLPSEKDLIQAIIVPLLVYDKSGHRLGYGKGYYDKFLDSLAGNVIKIGVSFFSPVETVFPEKHDIPLNYCLTPNVSYKF